MRQSQVPLKRQKAHQKFQGLLLHIPENVLIKGTRSFWSKEREELKYKLHGRQVNGN